MTLDITLYGDEWQVGDYMITGTIDEGYDVYANIDPNTILYSSNDFESCLVWIMNS